MPDDQTKTTAPWPIAPRVSIREQAIQAAVIEMSLFTGNLEMKVRKAIDRYEWVLKCGVEGITS